MPDNYRLNEITRVLSAGPIEGEDWYRLVISGAESTKHLNVSPDEVTDLALTLNMNDNDHAADVLFKLHITCDNAAFDADDPDAVQGAHDNARDAEVVRILRYAADRIEHGTRGPLLDSNGNTVGSYGYFREVYGQEAHIS